MSCFQELCPAPKSFRAWIDRWSNTESALIPRINNHSIKQERLPGPILASDANDTDRLFNPLKELSCLVADYVRLSRLLVLNHVNRLAMLNNLINLRCKLTLLTISILITLRTSIIHFLHNGVCWLISVLRIQRLIRHVTIFFR